MANKTVKDALEMARSVLGDDLGLVWTDALLFPKVTQAHSEMIAKLALNGINMVVTGTSRITVTAGAADLGANMPANIIRVIKLRELAPTDPIQYSVPMTKKEIIPDEQQGTTLRYWSFNGEIIQFLGATTNRDVIVQYLREPTAPVEVNSLLDFKLSEIFIGPRVAALAVATKDKQLYQMANQMAEENLSRLVRTQVKGDQNLRVRRRPFSYMNRRGGRFA